MKRTASSAPTSWGTSCVPPHPGMSPRKTSGQAKWRTDDAIVRKSQWSAISTPPPSAAPLIAATVTNGRSRIRPKSSCPARPPSRARSGSIAPNSPMSAPTAKTNGLPVSNSPRQSRERSWSRTASAERSAASPNVFGFCQSSPLSIVTSAIGPTRDASFRSLNSVGGLATVLGVLPEDRGAHAEPDTQCRQPVARSGSVAEAARELSHETDACGGKGMAAGDRAAVRIQPRIIGRHTDAVAPGEHLDSERLVQLEQVDVVDSDSGTGENLVGRGDRAETHEVRLDTCVREGDETHLRRETEF